MPLKLPSTLQSSLHSRPFLQPLWPLVLSPCALYTVCLQVRGKYSHWRFDMHQDMRDAVLEAFSFNDGNAAGKRGPWYNDGNWNKEIGNWFKDGMPCVICGLLLCHQQ